MASAHSFDPAPTRSDGGAALALWGPRLVLAALALAAVRAGWTGFIASDDASYYAGAVEWLRDPPFAGDSHWTTRFPVVLTLAAGAYVVAGALSDARRLALSLVYVIVRRSPAPGTDG